MQAIGVDTWEELSEQVDRLRSERMELMQVRHGHSSELLFRGQGNSRWKLQTTLERSAPHVKTFAQYFRLISIAKPQIETFLPHRWDLAEYSDLEKWAAEYDNLKLTRFPGYDYLVYLRHHGFPSPLLDWTRSLAIAAYFAFEDAPEDMAAIYVFWEERGWGKAGASNAPQIVSFGPYVRSHPRHFNQQSSYTICCQFDSGPWKFSPHDLVYGTSKNDQDRLWKFTLPTSERTKMLRLLDANNINAYSLFQNEEALLRTIATRELLLREREL
jgi:hypothetical protein